MAHCKLANATVLQRVMQRFLGDSKEAEGNILLQLIRHILVMELDVNPVQFRKFPAEASYGGYHAQVTKL